MAFHVQFGRLRQGGGNFSLEDLRVVLLELWDRVEAGPGPVPPPAPPSAPPNPMAGVDQSPGVEAP